MPDTQTGKQGFLGRLAAMPNDSTFKTVFVAVALCLFCSMIVAAAAVALRPVQKENQVLDMRRNILEVTGLYKEGENVNKVFETAFEPKVVELKTGNYLDNIDASTYDEAAVAQDPKTSRALAEDPAGIGREALYKTVYLLKDDSGKLKMVVLPIHGYGLWSTLWGFIAIEADGDTIYGLQFYQQGETPGLGGEVDNPRWRALWHGKELLNDQGQLAINVSKGSPTGEAAKYHIDALAGATLTSRGVDNLVRFWMGNEGFGPFLEKLRKGEV